MWRPLILSFSLEFVGVCIFLDVESSQDTKTKLIVLKTDTLYGISSVLLLWIRVASFLA